MACRLIVQKILRGGVGAQDFAKSLREVLSMALSCPPAWFATPERPRRLAPPRSGTDSLGCCQDWEGSHCVLRSCPVQSLALSHQCDPEKSALQSRPTPPRLRREPEAAGHPPPRRPARPSSIRVPGAHRRHWRCFCLVSAFMNRRNQPPPLTPPVEIIRSTPPGVMSAPLPK